MWGALVACSSPSGPEAWRRGRLRHCHRDTAGFPTAAAAGTAAATASNATASYFAGAELGFSQLVLAPFVDASH